MKFKLLIVLCAFIFVSSCEKALIEQEYKNNPEDVFEAMWNEYDMLYALFNVKNIDWDSIYSEYRPLVHSSTTEDELYTVLTSMLKNLNDNHVYLYAPGQEEFRAGSLFHLPAFPDSEYENYTSDEEKFLNLLKNKYLNNQYELTSKYNLLFYGLIDKIFTGDKIIGYFYVGGEDYNDRDFTHL